MSTASAIDRLIQDLLAADIAPSISPQYDGLDLNEVGTHGRTPLMAVAMEGLVAAAEALVHAGASVGATGHLFQMTPLHEAACSGHTEMAEFLLSHGAGVDAEADQGVTPLMCAAAWGNTAIVSLLLGAGADWARTDARGGTAADAARE